MVQAFVGCLQARGSKQAVKMWAEHAVRPRCLWRLSPTGPFSCLHPVPHPYASNEHESRRTNIQADEVLVQESSSQGPPWRGEGIHRHQAQTCGLASHSRHRVHQGQQAVLRHESIPEQQVGKALAPGLGLQLGLGGDQTCSIAAAI